MRSVQMRRALLVMLTICALTYANGQESTPPDLETPQARAQAIREAVIEAYGSPDIISSFHASQHAAGRQAASPTVSPPPPAKQNSKRDPLAVLARIYSQMDVSDLFVSSFSQAMYMGLEQPQGASAKAGAPARSLAQRLLFSLLDNVAGSIPYSDIAAEAAERGLSRAAAEKVEFERNRSRGARHMAEARAFVNAVLSTDDQKRYEDGDLVVKASLLFRAAHQTLEKQEIPNAYVLWLVDSRGADGVKSHGAREQLSASADPNNPKYQVATWDRLSESEKWNVATDSIKLLTLRAEKALASPGSDPEMSSLLASSLTGPEGDAVLKAVGPEVYARWKSAPDSEKQRIAAGAAAIEAGMDMLMPMLIGDNRVPIHTNPASQMNP